MSDELKTLRNVTPNHDEESRVMYYRKDLRDEAIKWWQSFEDSGGAHDFYVQRFIKQFFNLTEEDLK